MSILRDFSTLFRMAALGVFLLAAIVCRDAMAKEVPEERTSGRLGQMLYAQASGQIEKDVVDSVDTPMKIFQAIGAFNFETKTVLLNSGYYMPIVGLGTYSLSHDACVKSVIEHLRAGGRLIDTAFMYHNEKAVGQGVRQSGIPREEIFVITKLYPSQFADAEAAIEEALKKLNLGYIDMMLLHHPGAQDVEAYKAMERAVKAGKIRSIGISCYYIKELDRFLPQVTITPALVQNEIHPYYQDNDVISYRARVLSCRAGTLWAGGDILRRCSIIRPLPQSHKRTINPRPRSFSDGTCKKALLLYRGQVILPISGKTSTYLILNCRTKKWPGSMRLTAMKSMTGIKACANTKRIFFL